MLASEGQSESVEQTLSEPKNDTASGDAEGEVLGNDLAGGLPIY